MKKILVLLIIIAIHASCKNVSKDNTAAEVIDSFTVYKFKVSGLNDSIVSDSIWKMIFKIDGIDELVINKADSLVKVRISTENADKNLISGEIERRGGKIIEIIE
jgi:hypothetical protein